MEINVLNLQFRAKHLEEIWKSAKFSFYANMRDLVKPILLGLDRTVIVAEALAVFVLTTFCIILHILHIISIY